MAGTSGSATRALPVDDHGSGADPDCPGEPTAPGGSGQPQSPDAEQTTVPDPELTGDLLEPAMLESFATLGLSSDVLAAYELMLLSDDWSREQIQARLGCDEAGVAEALDTLVTKGLIVPSQEVADTLRPVTPRVVLHRLIEERDHSLRHAQERLSQTRAATQKLIDLVDENDTRQRSSLEHVTGRDRVADRISELLAGAGEEVLTMLTMLPSPESMETARRGDVALLERGVATRMIVLTGHVRRSREYVAYLSELVDLGADVRATATLPTRMILIDRTSAILPSDPDAPSAGATIIKHQSLIQLMRDTFESTWRAARSLDVGEERPEQWEPSELELEVIRLLGSGNKDEAIARRVGMSLRSVRRLISQVSTELGSKSRFELGLICGNRGWVEPDPRP